MTKYSSPKQGLDTKPPVTFGELKVVFIFSAEMLTSIPGLFLGTRLQKSYIVIRIWKMGTNDINFPLT